MIIGSNFSRSKLTFKRWSKWICIDISQKIKIIYRNLFSFLRLLIFWKFLQPQLHFEGQNYLSLSIFCKNIVLIFCFGVLKLDLPTILVNRTIFCHQILHTIVKISAKQFLSYFFSNAGHAKCFLILYSFFI